MYLCATVPVPNPVVVVIRAGEVCVFDGRGRHAPRSWVLAPGVYMCGERITTHTKGNPMVK